MNEEIIAAIESEEEKLVQRLDAVRQMLAVYRGEAGSASPKAPKPTKPSAAFKAQRNVEDRMDKFGPYGQRIVDAVSRLLPGVGGNPVPTRKLVEQLEQLNIEITGENKVNALSALLARSSKMKGYGRAGWTLQSEAPGEMFPQKPASEENTETVAAPSQGVFASQPNTNPFAKFQQPRTGF